MISCDLAGRIISDRKCFEQSDEMRARWMEEYKLAQGVANL